MLTVDDLAERVRRAPKELGVQTAGVKVVGVLVRRASGCTPEAVDACQPGPLGKHRFAASLAADAPAMSVVLSSGTFQLVEGETYVLDGAVEAAPDVPERWLLRAQVLATVRR